MADAETCYGRDDQLIALYSKAPVIPGAREFSLDYAVLHRDLSLSEIGQHIVDGRDYFKIEASIWSYTVEQAQIGNYHPLRLKLQSEARDLFMSDDEKAEVLAISLINLATSIQSGT